MWKILGGVVMGVFVGALAFELLSRHRPRLVADVEGSARRASRGFADAFAKGYRRG
jgi:hypothetical protein